MKVEQLFPPSDWEEAPPLHAVSSRSRVDAVAAEDAARRLLIALGADPDIPDLQETPRRIAAAYQELLTPEPFNPTTFPNDEGYDELVVVRDIPDDTFAAGNPCRIIKTLIID